MSRLIDADLLKQATKAPDKNGLTVFVEKVLCGLIDQAPTVDAVKVIRCKECDYYEADICGGDFGVCCHPDWVIENCGNQVDADGFCYRGKNKFV